MSAIVTFSELVEALMRDPRIKYSKEEAEEEAIRLLSRFGLEGYVLDNELTQQERMIVNCFADWGYIRTEKIEAEIKRRKKWAIFYWVLIPHKIKSVAKVQTVNTLSEDVYHQI